MRTNLRIIDGISEDFNTENLNLKSDTLTLGYIIFLIVFLMR